MNELLNSNGPLQVGAYPVYRLYWDRNFWANSVDPDQTAPWEQSDQGLYCLLAVL